jgi:RNA polymerase sigma factor (sigma-70 family)
MNSKSQSTTKQTDSQLVALSLTGDHDAFCAIVVKYQNLICSIAYASLGDIKLSEDVAQEVFIEAWQNLNGLRDSEKLKPWLCGILRFKISQSLRKESKQPFSHSEELTEHTSELENHPSLEEVTIAKEQQHMLWSRLSDLSIQYREPLVLFYRQQQSVEHVADALDLTIDTAKQRLSRGRNLLKQAMLASLKNTLQQTKPGSVFTAGVIAALGDLSKPATAAALSAGTAKTSSLLSFATVITVLASISGLISSFFGLKTGLHQSRTAKERKLTIILVTLFLGIALVFVLSLIGLRYLALVYPENQYSLAVIAQCIVIAFASSYLVLTARMLKTTRVLRAQERMDHPEAFTRDIDQKSSTKREYKSKFCLMGVPLIHIQFTSAEHHDLPACGWVAVGSRAHGLLLAWGGFAIAPVSVGIVSVGVVTCGAVGIGIFSTGSLAIGLIGFGAAAIGYKAYSAMSSLGWESAFSNGFSIAREAAIGPIAYAKEVNNELATQIGQLSLLGESYQWVLAAIALSVITPSMLYYSKSKNA